MSGRDRRENFNVPAPEKKQDSADAEKIKAEVEKLAQKGTLDQRDISNLYNTYGNNDNIIDEILRQRSKRYKQVIAQASKAAEKVLRKYREGRPLHTILEKMLKHKTAHKWSDAEYDQFRKELSARLTGNRASEIDLNQNLSAYRSRINKALGSSPVTVVEEGLRIKDSDQPYLAEMLSMFEKSSALHKSVFMQGLIYKDTDHIAMTGEYKRDKHLATNYIHPLIACMFLPKFDLFDTHMLYSNFGAIVKCRNEKKPIVTEPDLLLYYDITSDPNDVVCEINSPMADLRNRYRVQISLWETVAKLRSGNYYDVTPHTEFLTALNACRNNLYDNADLAYSQDEGAILRRLLSVFSLRPTIIKTAPLYSLSSFGVGPFGSMAGFGGMAGMPGFNNGMSGSSMPFYPQPVYTVTSIPMITLQIPPFREGAERINLKDATMQTIWINENKTIVPKEQSIIYSKEVLIFYVNRRVQKIQIRTFSSPITFSQLPLTMSNLERLNDYPIDVPERIALHTGADQVYLLRSVVAVTQTEITQGDRTTNIITGNTGLIMSHRNFETNIFEPNYFLYDPFGASLPVRHPVEPGYMMNKPISIIEPYITPPAEMTDGIVNLSFIDRASKTGTIYFYAKSTGYNPFEMISLN